jgi:MFS family permease
MFLVGVAGFTLASLACGLAPSSEVLAAARIAQGAAAAVMVPQVMSIIHADFPVEEQPKAFAIFGAISGIGAVAGPILGGVLIAGDPLGLGWRAIFLINVPVGLIAMFAGHRLIRESRPPTALRLDLPGVAFATLGLLLLLYPLVQGHERGWPWWSFSSMLASVPVLLIFVMHQRARTRSGRSPLVVLDLFRARTFVAGLGVQLAFYVTIGLFFLSWSLYLQVGLDFTALRAGLTTLGFAIGAFLSSATAVMVLLGRFGRRVLMAGLIVMAAGVVAMALVVNSAGIDVTSWHLVGPLTVIGFGFGLIAAPLPVLILTDVPLGSSGSASGLANTMVQLGNAVGIALVSLAFLLPLGRGDATAQGFVDAFEASLGWMVGTLMLVLALTFALPRHIRPEPRLTESEAIDPLPKPA